jgi:hypothetical protein
MIVWLWDAQVQAAELVDGSDVLDPYYRRFGERWRAWRTQGGAFRWDLCQGRTFHTS